MTTPIALRAPTTPGLTQPPNQQPSFSAPTPLWLSGTWHVTHSTLPMWKSKRNVTITYHPLPPSVIRDDTTTDKIDDQVSYQTFTSDKIKTVSGIDTASAGDGGAWDWRGKGWLMVASSHWEVLGWGDLEGGQQWVVTYFAKTLFTPAGVDVYSRTKEGLGEGVVGEIREALGGVEHQGVKGLVGQMFEVKRD